MRGSRSRMRHDRAVINCQYSMATFSTAERKRRPHGDRKSTEMSLHLKQTFEAAVMTQLYPRSQIDIYVKVNVEQWEVDFDVLTVQCWDDHPGVKKKKKTNKMMFLIVLKCMKAFLFSFQSDSAVRWRELQCLCERCHSGCDWCRHPHAGLCVCLYGRVCGWDAPRWPLLCRGKWRSEFSCLSTVAQGRTDCSAADGCQTTSGPLRGSDWSCHDGL